MANQVNDTLCVPMKLDAFILNTSVCDGADTSAKIAPITQPNYTFLRLHDSLIQADILPHVDIHNTFNPNYNSRITDLENGKPYRRRQGVYLHWMLPRVYRTGVAATEDSELDRDRDHRFGAEKTAPQFRPVPTRWLIIRQIRDSVSTYETLTIPSYKAWVLESDHQQMVEKIGSDQDLQVDVSPFVAGPFGEKESIQKQAEIFIGKKTPVGSWTEKEEPGKKVTPLTVLNGGNILFPDFQQHNSNVFSILDNFEYEKGDGVAYLDSATADYYVIGWHARPDEDPFYLTPNSGTDRGTRLKQCQMALASKSSNASDWEKKSQSAHTICHGAMYSVKWNINEKPKTVPADSLCRQLQESMPVAVGTTPLDSLLAYVRAHQQNEHDPDIKQVMQTIENIQKFLLVQEDNVDEQEQAEDLLYNYNYDTASGGNRYHLATSDPSQPTKSNPAVIEAIAHLNREQARLDSLSRMVQRLRWKLFARWWEFVTKGTSTDTEMKRLKEHCSKDIKVIMDDWEKTRTAYENARKEVEKGKLQVEEKHGNVMGISVHPNFHVQRDPTLLVGKIQSSWPHDWLEALRVRLYDDITTSKERELIDPIYEDIGVLKLPTSIRETAKALVEEFIELQSDEYGSHQVLADKIKPLYHDAGITKDTPMRDQWGDTQPFFPLFLEWEAEYAHIDYSLWSLEERKISGQGSAKLSYGIKDQTPLDKKWQSKEKMFQNLRMLSGRVLILPQPAFSLRSQIQQVIDQTPIDELEDYLPKDRRDQLLQNLEKLAYLSSPLAGFHDHLLTMAQGTHIKPTIRYNGETLMPIDGAEDNDAGFSKERFNVMGTETDLTPYGTLVHLSKETEDSPFKPVTHGQFKITKLSIIDKFGQVIHALDPRWDAKPQRLRPCLSEYYAPQLLPDGTPNLVEKEVPEMKGSHFAQIPPHINQWARVNSEFVERNKQGAWAPQDEWGNPIWAWMVYNRLDYAIQFFLKDGTFYREVATGGPFGSRKSEKWLPFKKTIDDNSKNGQLDRLIEALEKEESLHAFIDMIQESMDYANSAPDAYAQFLNSIIGRPLALVNMGWSLELATDEYKNQSQVNVNKPHRALLDKDSSSSNEVYEFPFKLGDKKRTYDGLVGYFKFLKSPEPEYDNYLDLSACYTYFGFKKGSQPKSPLVDVQSDSNTVLKLVKIQPDNYPKLEPYFIDPVKNNTAAMETKRNAMLAKNMFGAIIDPFNPVHGYTGILPIQPLKLPPWTWQDAMNTMTAFFHFGPLHVTKDVPTLESIVQDDKGKEKVLRADTDLKDPKAIVDNGIKLPTMGSADWVWLQPYTDHEEGNEVTSFVPLGIAGAETTPKFEEGPYTTVEGYLQLRQPLVRALEKKK